MILSCGGSDGGSGTNSTPPIGGQCTYSSTPGTSIITELKVVTGGIEAHFNFVPTDPNASTDPGDTDNYLVLSTGLPTQEWIDSQKIIVGTNLTTIRQDILTGTCTPVIYSFPTLPDDPHGS
jgi:hypothetical protein